MVLNYLPRTEMTVELFKFLVNILLSDYMGSIEVRNIVEQGYQ